MFGYFGHNDTNRYSLMWAEYDFATTYHQHFDAYDLDQLSRSRCGP